MKIVTNLELLRIATALVADYGGVPGATLRLFKNDITPSPAITVSDLTECDASNYTPKLLTGDLSAPAKVADGWYESVSSVYTYQPSFTGLPNTVYGSYVLFGGQVVALSYFPEVQKIGTGGVPFKLQLRLAIKSESLF